MAINIESSPSFEIALTGFDGATIILLLLTVAAILEWFIRADRKPWFLALAAFSCGAWPLIVVLNGYGTYLGYGGWFIALLGSLLLCCMFLSAEQGLPYFSIWKRTPPRARAESAQQNPLRFVTGILCCGLFFLCSWFVGIQIRKAYCRHLCRAAEPLFNALEEYRSLHGFYPDHLKKLPNALILESETGLVIREGPLINKSLDLDLGELGESNLTIYFAPNGDFVCLVPIERPFLMSFTRFEVFLRSSENSRWQEDSILWQLHPMK